MKNISTYGLIFATAVMFHFAQAAEGQTFKDRLMKMQEEYSTLETVHIEMSIKVFESPDSQTPYFNEKAEVKRQFQNYFYQFGSIDMLMNSRYLVMVDKTSKEIVCTKRSLDAEKEMFSDPFKINMDSILSLYEDPRFLGKSGGIQHYSLNQRKGVIEKIDLFIDETNNILKRMTYLYRDEQYVVIEFTVFDKNPDFENFNFQEDRYVGSEKGKLKAADSFRGYNVVEVDGR